MYPVDLTHYMRRIAAWRRAAPAERKRVAGRYLGRPCVEHWARGVLVARCVDVGGGMRELWADRGIPARRYEQGHIAFHTWDEAETSFGAGKAAKW